MRSSRTRPSTWTLEPRTLPMTLTWLDWLLMLVYFAFVLGVGVTLKRSPTTSAAFFQAGRAIPAWVCGLALISANLGAELPWYRRPSIVGVLVLAGTVALN